MLIREVQCDACDKRAKVNEVTGWLHVMTYASGVEEALELNEKAENNAIVTEGDLCGLACLSSWAGGLHNLQELDKPTPPTPKDPGVGRYL